MSHLDDTLTIKRSSKLTSTKEKTEDQSPPVLSLRPKSFNEYPGQQRTKENLKQVFQIYCPVRE